VHTSRVAPLYSAVTLEGARHFLSQRGGPPARDVRPLAGGEFSRAYAYRQGARALVVRFSADGTAFEKDRLAHALCAGLGLPIPPVLEVGSHAGGSYAISPLLPGVLVQDVDRATALALVPPLLDALHRIWPVDIAAPSGFGGWNRTGRGRYASWRAVLASSLDDDRGGVLDGWRGALATGMLDRARYTALHEELLRHLDRCPDARRLLHGDFGFSNALTDGGALTGILDWGLSLYGDPVYDVARMDFWAEAMPAGHIDWLGALTDYRSARGLPPFENLEARLRCYELYHGLWNARYYALAGRPDAVAWSIRKAAAAAAALRAATDSSGQHAWAGTPAPTPDGHRNPFPG